MITRIRRLSVAVSTLILTLTPLMLAPTATASTVINEYPITGCPNNCSMNGITSGPDGALWAGVYNGVNSYVDRVTTSGNITSYQVTCCSDSNGAYDFPGRITTGPDGTLWFTLGGGASKGFIGQITTSGNVTKFPMNGNPAPYGIASGPDGNLWFANNQGNSIGSISTSGTFGSNYPVPTGANNPVNIVTGVDGALWFTVGSNNIYRVTTAGVFTGYPISSGAFDITTGPDGALWFTESSGNKIGRISTSGDVTEYPVPTATSNPNGITSGPDGALWFSEKTGNKIGRITTSGAITEYALPTSAANPTSITTGSDGSLWFSDKNGVGQFIPETIPSAPSNLTASSPAQTPVLSWTSVLGADSYNIYRNGINIGSSSSTSFTDSSAPEGNDTYYVTAVNGAGEGSSSNSITVLVDRTAPTITYSVSPIPNSNGWNNSPATVTFNCVDNTGGSGIASCSPPQSESVDGSYTLSGTAIDNAGNSSDATATLNIDQTAPTVSNVTLATDPLAVNQTTALSATIADNTSGVSKAEYYTYVRTQDNAGNWSTPMSVTLDVYNPAGGYAAGHGSVVPNGSTSNTNPSDVLPTETGNNLKANFDFTVKYVNSTDTTPTGTSTFTWGSTCNNPHSDCFVVTTDATVTPAIGSLAWLIDPGDNTATFQGTASVSQGSTNLGTNYPVKVSVTGTTTTSPGHYLLQVYSVGADPATASPLYQASGDLSGGSVVLHG